MATSKKRDYDSGNKPITADELKGDSTAIRLFMKGYENKCDELTDIKLKYENLLRNATLLENNQKNNNRAVLISLIGSALTAYGVNLLSSNDVAGWITVVSGIVLTLVGSSFIIKIDWSKLFKK